MIGVRFVRLRDAWAGNVAWVTPIVDPAVDAIVDGATTAWAST